MFYKLLVFTILLVMYSAESDFFFFYNESKPTISGIAEYRSALTLDWLAAEDMRQRQLASAFETEASPPLQILASDCISYEKPASGKVARLMLELLKNLEGDEGILIPDLIQALIRTKLLVETSLLEAEPDLESLVKTPDVMMGEPHTTFPRILALSWIAATDPTVVKKHGWCPITRVTKYLLMTRPTLIAKHMRNIDPVIARARFLMEEFIQHITPKMYDKHFDFVKRKPKNKSVPLRIPTKHFIHAYPENLKLINPPGGDQVLPPTATQLVVVNAPPVDEHVPERNLLESYNEANVNNRLSVVLFWLSAFLFLLVYVNVL